MQNQYRFDPFLYWQRYRLPLILSWSISIILDVILIWLLNSSMVSTIDQIARSYSKNAIIFLIIVNNLLLKLITLWIWWFNKLLHRNGYIEFIRDTVVHKDKVAWLSRFLAKLRLVSLANERKTKFNFVNQYRILQIKKVTKNRWGDLLICGRIERQWIDESLDLSPDLDWNSDEKVIVSTHCIPNYYQNMNDLEQNLGKMVK